MKLLQAIEAFYQTVNASMKDILGNAGVCMADIEGVFTDV